MISIDLRPICKQNRWRWRYEEGFKETPIESKKTEALFYVEIICKYGIIYPRGGAKLLIDTEGHPQIRAKLLDRISSLEQYQGNEVFSFDIQLLGAVAEIVKPRTKRIVSRATIDRGTANLKAYHNRMQNINHKQTNTRRI